MKSSRFRFGYPSRLLKMPLREAIGRIASWDVDGVQFDLRNELTGDSLSETGRRQLRHLLKEHGLEIAPAVFPLRRPLEDEIGLEERLAVLTKTLRFAGELRAKGLILRPGGIPETGTSERAILEEVLNDLARVGNHVGVTPLLASGRESVATLQEFTSAVTAGAIGIAWDPAAAAMAQSDAELVMRQMPELVRQVRLRDGYREADGIPVETAVGRGEVDWEQIIALLAEADFAGWVTPERTGGDDPAGEAARAILYVRHVLPF